MLLAQQKAATWLSLFEAARMAQSRSDERMWAIAQTDARLMSELQRAAPKVFIKPSSNKYKEFLR